MTSERKNGVNAAFLEKQSSIFQLKSIDYDLPVLHGEIQNHEEVKDPNWVGTSIQKLHISC